MQCVNLTSVEASDYVPNEDQEARAIVESERGWTSAVERIVDQREADDDPKKEPQVRGGVEEKGRGATPIGFQLVRPEAQRAVHDDRVSDVLKERGLLVAVE